jgi:hypothetical protein
VSNLANACYLCTSAGYTNCIHCSHVSPPDYLFLWWQELEDGSTHDRRSDLDFLELLDLGLETEVDESEVPKNWRDWEDCLERMENG